MKAVPGLRTYTIGLIVHPHYTVVDHWFLTIRQAGFLLNINAVGGITNAASTGSFSSREASTKVVENTLNWLRGRHSIQTGGSWTRVDIWLKNQQYVPTINFGVDSADPANGLFATANFTGASQTQLDNAKNLFVVLTGRVLSINGEQRLDEATNKYLHAAAGHHRQHRSVRSVRARRQTPAIAIKEYRPDAISRRPTVPTASRSRSATATAAFARSSSRGHP